jgi:hypothetical protein
VTLRGRKSVDGVVRDGEEGYKLREVGKDGQGGWEEGGVDGSAGGGVSATAAAMERSIDRSSKNVVSDCKKCAQT